jgi:hypothetical protein
MVMYACFPEEVLTVRAVTIGGEVRRNPAAQTTIKETARMNPNASSTSRTGRDRPCGGDAASSKAETPFLLAIWCYGGQMTTGERSLPETQVTIM